MKSGHFIVLQAVLAVLLGAGAVAGPFFENCQEGLPLYYWKHHKAVNFGDYLSLKLLERIVDGPVAIYKKKHSRAEKKLLAIGSIFYFAEEGDVVWGSGINGKRLSKDDYSFSNLDIRAIRGPLSRAFLLENFGIEAPEIYGDPALLVPYFFPEFKKDPECRWDYVVILHYSEQHLFSKEDPRIVYATDPWDEIIEKIIHSRFVISSSLHGLIIAEAYGVPARWLRITETEPVFKYFDYYLGTGRQEPHYATSIAEALEMGGEAPFQCDLKKLYEAFPFDYWPRASIKELAF